MVTEIYVPDAKHPKLKFKEIRHKGIGRTVPWSRDADADVNVEAVDSGGIDASDNVAGNASANVTGGTQGKAKVHRTVKVRMQATYEAGRKKDQKYVPRGLVGYGVKQVFREADPEVFCVGGLRILFL